MVAITLMYICCTDLSDIINLLQLLILLYLNISTNCCSSLYMFVPLLNSISEQTGKLFINCLDVFQVILYKEITIKIKKNTHHQVISYNVCNMLFVYLFLVFN